MNTDIRNDYGFPAVQDNSALVSEFFMSIFGFDPTTRKPPSKWEIARQYAAEARIRNQRCNCHRCIEAEKLEAVQNILNNRESGGWK